MAATEDIIYRHLYICIYTYTSKTDQYHVRACFQFSSTNSPMKLHPDLFNLQFSSICC
ncbi:hypothetical protein Hanom_Chr10g00908951 [Helianthus anomalus]